MQRAERTTRWSRGTLAAVIRRNGARAPGARLGLLLLGFVAAAMPAAAMNEVEIAPAFRIAPDAPEWRELVALFERQPDRMADFAERRYFPFRRDPVELSGEVRVSRTHGLSLHYAAPGERVVIFDRQGMLIRDAAGQKSPTDPRAQGANAALFHVLRFDFHALERQFEIYGCREGAAWSLTLVPRAETERASIGNMHVAGQGAAVQRIELRRSPKQRVEIEISNSRSPVTFTADEVKRYFR